MTRARMVNRGKREKTMGKLSLERGWDLENF